MAGHRYTAVEAAMQLLTAALAVYDTPADLDICTRELATVAAMVAANDQVEGVLAALAQIAAWLAVVVAHDSPRFLHSRRAVFQVLSSVFDLPEIPR
jgi:hypothetical protein